MPRPSVASKKSMNIINLKVSIGCGLANSSSTKRERVRRCTKNGGLVTRLYRSFAGGRLIQITIVVSTVVACILEVANQVKLLNYMW